MKNLLIFISLIVLGFGLWAGHGGELAILATSFLSFVALLFAAHIDQISKIKASGTGFEAETRDVLKRAEITLNELQALAKQVGIVTLSLVKRNGRWGGYSDEESDKIKESILTVLKQVGIPEPELSELLREWHKFVEYDYTHAILGGNTIPEQSTPEVLKDFEKLRNSGIEFTPTPADLEGFLNRHGYMTADVQEWLKDYAHYIKSREHRRPEVWKRRHDIAPLKKSR